MTRWVDLERTGRGPNSNRIDLPAANDRTAWSAQRDIVPPVVSIVSADDYLVSRWAACMAWLNRWEPGESGPLTRADSALEGRPSGSIQVVNASLVAVAHWDLETAFGAHEYNWNAGGIHCAVNSAQCFREGAATGGEEFRSFESFADFARDYFELISRTPDYQPAWEAMKAGSANALLRLWRADYTCGAKTRAEATSLCLRVRRTLLARWSASIATVLPSERQITATEPDVPNRCGAESGNRGLRGGNAGGAGGSSGPGLGLLIGAALLALAVSGGKKSRVKA